jgi:HSP20 family protein
MMTLTRWQPLIDEVMPVREVARSLTPAIELTTTADAFTLRAQLPGIDLKDVEVQVSRRAIALSGETQPASTGYSEFRYGKFRRVIPLPAPVQPDQVQSNFKDGILTLTLPRLKPVQPTVVKLNLTPDQPQSDLTEDAWG